MAVVQNTSAEGRKPAAPEAPTGFVEKPRNKGILIIEDDPIISLVYRNNFQKAGFDVEVATDGQAGFYKIHKSYPDALLLDLMLPHINGVEILKTIRANPAQKDLPVFVFTNAYLSDLSNEARAAGATHVFNKATTSPKEIILAVNAALKDPRTPEVQAKAVAAATLDDGAALRSFLAQAPETLATLRKQLQNFAKADKEDTRISLLVDLFGKIHGVTGSASIAGLAQIAVVGSALEALLKQLHEKPKHINPSTLRTVSHAVDVLGLLFERGDGKHSVLSRWVRSAGE